MDELNIYYLKFVSGKMKKNCFYAVPDSLPIDPQTLKEKISTVNYSPSLNSDHSLEQLVSSVEETLEEKGFVKLHGVKQTRKYEVYAGIIAQRYEIHYTKRGGVVVTQLHGA